MDTTLAEAWGKALHKIAMIVPNLIIGTDEKPSHGHRDTIVKIIPLLIMVLSAASITNLSHRAYAHHAGWSSYLVGAGLAALVPVAVFVAIKIDGAWYKGAVWIIASVFAGISAAIQYQVYLPATTPSMDQMLEALAFGAGVPVAECLLAAMEAFLLRQGDNHDQALLRAEAEAARQAQLDADARRRQDEQDANERTQLEADRLHAERMRAIELQAHATKLAQDAELEREAKLAQIRIKEASAAAKNASKNVLKNSRQSVENGVELDNKNSTSTSGDGVEFNNKKAKIQQRRHVIFQHIQTQGDPGPSALSNQLGVDRGTIYGDLKALADQGLIYKNGGDKYHAKG